MKLEIQFRNVKPNKALTNYITYKCQKLHKTIHKADSIKAIVSLDGADKKIELRIYEYNVCFVASAKDGDFYLATDHALKRMEKQLKRKKEKINNHKPFDLSVSSDDIRKAS